MTSCGCFECISCVLPLTNGIMIVYRDFPGMTPSGMKFSTLAGTVGGGVQTPGFIGHSKLYIGSPKFISAEGGLRAGRLDEPRAQGGAGRPAPPVRGAGRHPRISST